VSRRGGLRLRGRFNDLANLFVALGRRAAPAWRILLDASEAQRGEPLAPDADGAWPSVQLLSDLIIAFANRRGKDDFGA